MSPLFKQKDDAEGQLFANIDASSLTIILKGGEGANFPQPIKGAATSAGTSTVLNSTGIGALGLSVGDYIYNYTDGSWGFVVAINTNDIETTTLYGGADNTWQNTDEFVVKQFVITLNKRDSEGVITQKEQVLIHERSTDILTVPTGGRGYNGSTPGEFVADDYVSILVDELMPDGVEQVMSANDIKKFENDFSQGIPNNVTFKGVDNAGTSLIDLFKLTTSDIFEFQTHPRTLSSRVIANDYDLIDLKYFNDNTVTAGVKSFTLSENLTAGDVVKVINDAGTEKIAALIATSVGSGVQFDANAIATPSVDILDEDKIIVTYEITSLNYIYAVVGQISGTTLTFGTPSVMHSGGANTFSVVRQLDTDKFVCAWINTTTGLGYSRVCTVSGTTITNGALVQFESTNDPSAIDIVILAVDKFVTLWVETVTNDMNARAASVSGTGHTYGSELILQSANAQGQHAMMGAKVETDTFIAGWENTSTSEQHLAVCTVSSTTITEQFENNINLGGDGSDFGIFQIGDGVQNTFGYYYNDEADADRLGRIGIGFANEAGTNLNLASAATLFDFKNSPLVRSIDEDRLVILDRNSSPNNAFLLAEIIDSQISVYETEVFDTDSIGWVAFSKSNSDGMFVIVADNNTSSDGQGYVVEPSDRNKAAGILTETGTTGQAKSVTIPGGLNSNQSFTASQIGRQAYIQKDGTLGTEYSPYKFGRIMSTTEVAIY